MNSPKRSLNAFETGSTTPGEAASSRIIQLLAVLILGLGAFVGVSWWLGRWQALAFGTTQVPMAPTTAFSFVLIGISLLIANRWPHSSAVQRFRIGCLAIVVVLSLTLGSQGLLGHDPALERWIVGEPLTDTSIPAGRMSPLTALAFVLASIALYCQWSVLHRHLMCLSISVILSWSIFLISEVTLIGHLTGLPPVLGNSPVPPAALTAFAFLLTSIAILLPALRQVTLLNLPAGTQPIGALGRIVATAAAGFVVAAVLRAVIVGELAGDVLPYVTFYPAVLLVALFTGLGGGLLATLLAGIYVQAWLHGGTLTGTEWLALAVFFIGSTIISLICETARQNRARERGATARLERALTEQEQAADALRQSEAKFRSVFEQAAVGVARSAIDGRLLEVNERLCAILGFSREELLSRAFQDITHPDDLQADLDSVEKLLKNEIENYSIETRCCRKDGDVVWVNLTASLVRTSAGDPDYFISIIEDISERRNLFDRLEKIAAHVPGVVYQYQQWPDGRAAFPYASEGIRDIYGVEPAAVASDATAVFKVIHPDDLARIRANVAESMQGLTTWQDMYRIELADGRMIWAEGEASPEPQPDGSVLWNGYIRDVTSRVRDEEARRHLQSMLARTERLAHIGSWELDVATNAVTWSEELFRIFQMDPAEGVPPFTEHHKLFAPEDFARLKVAMSEVIAERKPYALELLARRRDGTTRVCFARGYPETASNREVTRVWGSFQDISESKQAEGRLRLAANVLEHSFEGILITDAENRIIETNPAFSAITGFDQASVLGKDPSILASGRHDASFYQAMWDEIRRKGTWRGEIWNRRKDGEVYAELLSVSTVRDDNGAIQNHIAIFSDISELKAHEAELVRVANYDHLTGLPNRRLLSDRLEQAIAGMRRSRRQIAVCYLDLDGFKPINDRYGHEVGDQLLVGIANRLREMLRAQDTVARVGGDEFVLLFNDLSRLEDSQRLLDRVLAAASSPLIIDGVAHRVSASIGVTLSPPDIDGADSLLRHADQAMYRAKEAGRNRYHLYDAAQDRLIQERRVRMQGIETALTDQAFVLYYQPKVDMIDRRVIGLEALIRWQHPDEGLLLPGAFLPAVEGSDLELAVGEWVITAALRQVAAWQRIGLTLPVSVNISAGHLLAPDFPQRLERLLAEYPECDPVHLQLEILETSALSDIERASQTLTSCRAMGVRVALDDFGTGYSSLAYFRRLPIDELKIDQSFVRDMLDDPNDMEIVESVVRLAHAFNREVVAEGVETPEHGALLTLAGCRFGQGYGIARPMPASEIPHWVSTWPTQGASMFVKDVDKEDMPLVMAIENHRHWVGEFIDALRDADLSRLADIDKGPCRFEAWYQGRGSQRYGKLDEFQRIGQHHASVHQIASAIAALAAQGRMESAQTRVSSLLTARDELISQLRRLLDKEGNSGRPSDPGDQGKTRHATE